MRKPALLSSAFGLLFAYTMLLQDLLRDLRIAPAAAVRPDHDHRSRGDRGEAQVIAGPWVTRVDEPGPDARRAVLRPVEALLYE